MHQASFIPTSSHFTILHSTAEKACRTANQRSRNPSLWIEASRDISKIVTTQCCWRVCLDISVASQIVEPTTVRRNIPPSPACSILKYDFSQHMVWYGAYPHVATRTRARFTNHYTSDLLRPCTEATNPESFMGFGIFAMKLPLFVDGRLNKLRKLEYYGA